MNPCYCLDTAERAFDRRLPGSRPLAGKST